MCTLCVSCLWWWRWCRKPADPPLTHTFLAWSLSSIWPRSLPLAWAILFPDTRFPTITDAGPISGGGAGRRDESSVWTRNCCTQNQAAHSANTINGFYIFIWLQSTIVKKHINAKIRIELSRQETHSCQQWLRCNWAPHRAVTDRLWVSTHNIRTLEVGRPNSETDFFNLCFLGTFLSSILFSLFGSFHLNSGWHLCLPELETVNTSNHWSQRSAIFSEVTFTYSDMLPIISSSDEEAGGVVMFHTDLSHADLVSETA